MRNLLQEQLLKAGLAKKGKVDAIAREQARQRQGKASSPTVDAITVDARALQAERVERDRALAAERNAQAHARELRAQVRQIVETGKLARNGDIAYRFEDGGVIRDILVDSSQRTMLARGALAIARHDQGHELLPRAIADKVHARDPAMIVLDHGRGIEPAGAGEDDDHYARFKVPDDLIW